MGFGDSSGSPSKEVSMKRSTLNLAVDLVAFIGFIVLTTTGVLLRYVLPSGSGHYSTIWGLDRHEWGGVHFWIAVVFFSVLGLHLVLHWRWILSRVTRRPREGSGIRAGLGVVGLATLVMLAVSPLLTPVERDLTEKGASYRSSQEYLEVSLQGSMTLEEVEASTGVPASHIIEALGLPESTSTTESLRHLKTDFGFGMNDIRRIVREYDDGE
jgi:hypothetical protein